MDGTLRRIGTWDRTRGIWATASADLFSEHSEPFSETWPTSGTTRGGVAFELPTPALRTAGTESSSLPTPRASRGASGTETMYALGAERTDGSRTQGEVLLKTPTSQLAVNGGSQHPDKRREGGHGPTLADEVEHLLPTPTVGNVTGGNARRGGARSSELLLPGVAMSLLPTPLTTTATGVQELEVRVGGRSKRGARTGPQSSGGSVSPDGTPLPPLSPPAAMEDTDSPRRSSSG